MDAEDMIKKYWSEDGKLKQYPAKKMLRESVLRMLAQKFEQGRIYTEKEVNAVIQDSILFSDHELIRREMFMYRILGRLRDGSQYWLEAAEDASQVK
ncbi:MAG: DUF2087 domain-containing protein [Lachnospiraceae bacterium]|nr:DUF2087 domain-containing protein [Lachnospiraceae bacterium]